MAKKQKSAKRSSTEAVAAKQPENKDNKPIAKKLKKEKPAKSKNPDKIRNFHCFIYFLLISENTPSEPSLDTPKPAEVIPEPIAKEETDVPIEKDGFVTDSESEDESPKPASERN